MKKIILLMFSTLLFSGCVNYQELNNIGIIDSLGIDYIDNKYVIVVNVLEINDDKNLTIKTYNNSDNNLISAFNNLHLIVNKNINYNNLSLLVLSSHLNDKNLKTIIDSIKNIKDFRNDFNTVYINSNQFYQLFGLKVSAKDLNNKIKLSSNELGIGDFITFESVLKDYLNDNNILINNLIIEQNQIIIDGYKIMNNNFLTKEESILYNYLKDKIEETTFKNDCLYLNIDESKTKITSKNNIINISIDSNFSLIGNDCSKKLSNKDIIDIYNKDLKKDITTLFNKYQSLDLFNFGNLIMKNDYWYYRNNYNNLINNLKLNIKISSDFNERGF